jgi:hypothetical protein
MQHMLGVQILEVIDDRLEIHHNNNLDQVLWKHKNHQVYCLHIDDPNHLLHDHLFKERKNNLIIFIFFVCFFYRNLFLRLYILVPN